MNQTISLTLTIRQYESSRELLLSLSNLLKNRKVIFSGTKNISADIIAVSLLQNRYQFMHHADDVFAEYGNRRTFKFRLYEVAALSYFLSDCGGLPDHVDKLNTELKEIIKPFQYHQEKSEFQLWLEEKITDWEITYTQLRDQYPDMYARYEDEYNSKIKGEQDANRSMEASQTGA